MNSRVTALGALLVPLLFSGSPQKHVVSIDGVLQRLWLDPLPPAGTPRLLDLLTVDSGEVVELRHVGPALSLERYPANEVLRVRVSGSFDASGRRFAASSVEPIESPVPIATAKATAATVGQQTMSKRYLTLLCRFNGVDNEPRSREVLDLYFGGSTYPGQAHYWSHITRGFLEFDGSAVEGWFEMSKPLEAYFDKKSDRSPDLVRGYWGDMANDCLNAAVPHVSFDGYDGFNLHFNGVFFVAIGGGWWLGHGETPRAVGMTWLPVQSSPHVITHEIGHTLGLPHSSTPYEHSYGSAWDVMSQGLFLDPVVGDHVSVGTIAYHHMLLGSISREPPDVYVPAPATREIITLAPLSDGGDALPRAVRFPADAGPYYLVEARRKVMPYEIGLPYSGVLVFRIDENAPGDVDYVPARIVDIDGNGNPNDQGATWTVGETFTDPEAGLSISVLATTPEGYEVSVRYGWQLTVELTGGGEVAAVNDGFRCDSALCTKLYAERGESITLAAVPADGFHFLGWAGACSGTDPCTMTMEADRAVRAILVTPVVFTSDTVRSPAVLGGEYADTLTFEGGYGDATWTLVAGGLPAGLTLEEGTGAIRGVVGESGEFQFTVRVSAGLEGEQEFRMESVRPTLTRGQVLDHLLGGPQLPIDHQRFLDLIGNRNGAVDIGDVRAWLLSTGAIEPDLSDPPSQDGGENR